MFARPCLLAVSLIALAALAACNRDRPERAAPATPAPGEAAVVTPAEAAAPMAFESKTPYAEVSLTLPIALRSQPDLHARLYAANVRDLRTFAEGAQADRTEAGGDEGLPPYDKSIEFSPGAETTKLFSLMRTVSEFTGGAHPNAQYGAVLWDKALKREIAAADLFVKPADFTALDQALCAAINAEKRRRDPAAETVSLTGDGTWKCPRALETPFVLAASTEPGKAGGLTFLVGPYIVGPYAAGSYEVSVPLSAFRALIAPAYAGEFGGGLKPAA
jgi:ABC-type amino acid transport substrate-binding protein